MQDLLGVSRLNSHVQMEEKGGKCVQVEAPCASNVEPANEESTRSEAAVGADQNKTSFGGRPGTYGDEVLRSVEKHGPAGDHHAERRETRHESAAGAKHCHRDDGVGGA